jgi:hypothetical protein
MKPINKSALLARAAQRASLRRNYLGWIFARFGATEGKADQELAELFKTSVQNLQHVRLCLRPRSESFAADVDQIAQKFGLDAGRLAKIIRHVEALDGMADDHTNVASEAGLLLAARARRKKSDAPTRRKRHDPRSK